MLHRLSGASARGVECISQRGLSHVPLVRCFSSVEGIFFSSRLADIGPDRKAWCTNETALLLTSFLPVHRDALPAHLRGDPDCSHRPGERGGHQRRLHRTGGTVSVVQPTQLRPERLHLQSQHAAEQDPGDGRRGGKPTGLQPVRNSALCAAVRARHIWIQ